MNNLHDLFDRSFGQTIDNLSEYPDWLLKVSPTTSIAISKLTANSRPKDWLSLPDVARQLDIDEIKTQLIDANPELEHLRQVQSDFIVSRDDLTDTDQQGEEPTILVDALWLAFADFTTQSLFATFPRGDTPEISKEKFFVTLHFVSRISLFLNLFRGIEKNRKFSESPIGQVAASVNLSLKNNEDNQKSEYETIGEFWPNTWDAEDMIQNFVWISLLRFIVGHQLAHLHLHSKGECTTLEEFQRKCLVAGSSELSELVGMAGEEKGENYILEIEADRLAFQMCSRCAPDENNYQHLLMGGIYYLFKSLREVEQRTNCQGFYEGRFLGISSCLYNNEHGGEHFLYALDDQYQGKMEFYFKMTEDFA